MQLIHTLNSDMAVQQDGVTLFRYVYASKEAPVEAPRPYLHPLRTLGGRIVSGFRPHDHRWHHGLSFTSAFLGGHNFWGGPTYVDGGYKHLDNVGKQEVTHWESGSGEPVLKHRLHWVTAAGEELLTEERALGVKVFPDYWELTWSSALAYEGETPLLWGSPTTQGRENAGYGGLFWRGPREFFGGKILMSEGREGPDTMGQRSPWVAYVGKHDETDHSSTLIFVDDAQNPNHPSPWFVRNTTPMVCSNFAFGEEYAQQPGEIIKLNYKILIGDGEWRRERVEAAV
jgi:hypothetical protein